MMIAWEISIGSILTLVTMVFAAGGFYFSTKNQGKEITEIKNTLIKMEGVVTTVAVQKERIDNQGAIMTENSRSTNERISRVERMLDELRHNKGFVTN
jgi:hypothetical protein